MMVLRSMLFVPGNNMRMITKAATVASDGIIFDLEDAVSFADKETARVMVRDSIKVLKSGGFHLFVRVNALSTKLTAEDLNFVLVEGLNGIVLPKAETKSDVLGLEGMLEEGEDASGVKLGSTKVVPQIETAKGVVNAYEVAAASERVIAVAFGAGDYCRDLGRDVSQISAEQTELLYARSHIVNCSRASGVQVIDTPFLGLLTNRDGFMKETILAAQLGFSGKLLIHPTQIEFVNKTFTPSPGEVGYAKRVVEAFEEAEARGLGAISFEGKMVDYMNYTQAKDLLRFVERIAETEERRKRVPSTSLLQFFKSSSLLDE